MANKLKGLLFILIAIPCCVRAQLSLPALFSDNMILQQQARVSIWGKDLPDKKVTISGSWDHKQVETTADSAGNFSVKLQTPEAGGPYEISIQGSGSRDLHNVLIGEVWIASGQSNMEMPMEGWPSAKAIVENGTEEIGKANHPDIRLFKVKRKIAFSPEEDVTGSWKECNPESVANFSAAAYFFARKLQENLNIPIGIIESDWGGTPVESWISAGALEQVGDFDEKIGMLKYMRPYMNEMHRYEKQDESWKVLSEYINPTYKQADFDDSDWEEMKVPAYWEKEGYPNLDGVVWYRKRIVLPDSWAGKELTLNLDLINDEDMVWFNGEKIGATKGAKVPRSYQIPGNVVKTGKNTIAVRVTDTGNSGGLYGNPDKIEIHRQENRPEDKINLSGSWKFHIEFVKHHTPDIGQNPQNPMVLYNGMIAPLIPYTLKGVIWYQGESNVGRAAQYEKLFPLMIRDWRNRWDIGDFPFYFVQIAPFKYGDRMDKGTASAALREAQRKTLKLPGTGMVVTLDIGDSINIHPGKKKEVGERLAAWALARTYGASGIPYSGPLLKDQKTEGSAIWLSFDFADGMFLKSNAPEGFEIAGSDRKFVKAQTEIAGDRIKVFAPEIAHPEFVRYDWQDVVIPSLFNKWELPASSFSTEE